MQISLYLFISYGFIALVMFIASMLKKQEYVSEETSRKIIHIGVSNWYFIALYFASSIDIGLLIIPPITFIFFNYLSYRLNLVKGMERADKKDLGTVYYPIALLALLLFSNQIGKVDVGFLGFMVLGYGDGLAAVIGKKFGRTRSKSGKSFIGSLTMFIVSIFVNIGMWFERFVIVTTSLHRDFLPSSWDVFIPTLWDWTFLLSSIALFVWLFLMFVRYLPLISMAEMRGLVHETAQQASANKEES